MKKLLLATIASLGCITGFAQGRIGFANDSLHMVYYYSEPGDVPTAVSPGNMGYPGLTLVADLYMGTSSSSLWLYSSTTFGSTPGQWNFVSVVANANPSTGAPALPGGTSVFVIAQIRNSAYPAESQLNPAYGWYTYGLDDWTGWSQEFTFTLSTSAIQFPPMYNSLNWPAGTVSLDQYGVGHRGAILVGIPEPSTLGLIILSGATLFLFRRNDSGSPPAFGDY